MITGYVGAGEGWEGVGEGVGEQGWGRGRGMGNDHLQLPGDDDHWVRGGGGRGGRGGGRGGEWGTTTCGHPEMITRYMGAEEGVGEGVGARGGGHDMGLSGVRLISGLLTGCYFTMSVYAHVYFCV